MPLLYFFCWENLISIVMKSGDHSDELLYTREKFSLAIRTPKCEETDIIKQIVWFEGLDFSAFSAQKSHCAWNYDIFSAFAAYLFGWYYFVIQNPCCCCINIFSNFMLEPAEQKFLQSRFPFHQTPLWTHVEFWDCYVLQWSPYITSDFQHSSDNHY